MTPSSVNLKIYSQWQIISGIKGGKVKSVLPSEGEFIDTDPLLSTREETSGEARKYRADADTHQPNKPYQAHALRDQYRPQDLSHISRSPRIREMAEKMRESDKSNEVFTSMQKSKKYCEDYYYAMHEDNLRIKESMLNPIELAASNNADNLYCRKSMEATNTRELQKDITKEVKAPKINHWKLIL